LSRWTFLKEVKAELHISAYILQKSHTCHSIIVKGNVDVDLAGAGLSSNKVSCKIVLFNIIKKGFVKIDIVKKI